MHGDQAMTTALCAEIARGVKQAIARAADPASVAEVALCPPHILIPLAATALADSEVAVGAQDVDAHANGAFSGQISADMLVDSGCRYVIVGHSERRTHYHETDALVAQKTATALAAGLSAIVCCGETMAQRQAERTEQVVERQLAAALDGIGAADFANLVIAYEPVWAIGSGVTATPTQAQQAHHFIRQRLAAHNPRAATCRILYGGSMKPQNAAALLANADIDGGLIGGAALQASDFLAICNAAAT